MPYWICFVTSLVLSGRQCHSDVTHNVFSRGKEHDIVTKLSYNWFVPVLVINGRHGNNHGDRRAAGRPSGLGCQADLLFICQSLPCGSVCLDINTLHFLFEWRHFSCECCRTHKHFNRRCLLLFVLLKFCLKGIFWVLFHVISVKCCHISQNDSIKKLDTL